MRTIRTAVIGTGFMGKVHTEMIRRLGNVEVAGLAASPGRDCTGLGEAFCVERVTNDWRSRVEDPAIDGVHVCSPNARHAEQAEAALRAGKHVLCEKPLAMSSNQARRMLALAGQNALAGQQHRASLAMSRPRRRVQTPRQVVTDC